MSPAIYNRFATPHMVLPDEGDELETGVEAVPGITGQFPAENFFLVEQAKT
ncbi:MAG: hypothetical protein ACLP56_23975 [Candidatus Sulfotelmatobacter sp.]